MLFRHRGAAHDRKLVANIGDGSGTESMWPQLLSKSAGTNQVFFVDEQTGVGSDGERTSNGVSSSLREDIDFDKARIGGRES